MGNRGAPESAPEGAPGNRGAPESAPDSALPVQGYQEEHPHKHFLELGSTFQSTSREFPFSTPVAGRPDCNPRSQNLQNGLDCLGSPSPRCSAGFPTHSRHTNHRPWLLLF